MITLTASQINAWIVALIYPLTRILAFISTAPIWNTAGIPRRTRLILGLAITLAIAPALPEVKSVEPGTLPGLWLLAQQVLIGLAMGFAAKVVFAAIEFAGTLIGLQMGLGFATFYDPLNSSQTPVVSELLNMVAMMLFLALNGHLLYIGTLAQSFSTIPVSTLPLQADSWLAIAELGGKIFSIGLLIALPIVVALLITNIALAVLTKAAPQLNIFSLGFPITLLGGFFCLIIGLDYLAAPLQQMYEFAFSAMEKFALNGV